MLLEGIYRGSVTHRRHVPHAHQFTYPLAMVMLDLDTLRTQFNKSALWSVERFNLISFYRRDYLQSSLTDLKSAVQKLITERCGQVFNGQIKILTHPRYLGFIFNPVTFYFCVDAHQQIRFIVAEITNTPWNERYAYVFDIPSTAETQELVFDFDKQFHVSPFMPMQIHNHWRFKITAESVNIQMVLSQEDVTHFDVSMQVNASPFTAKSMRALPVQFPLQTLAVVFRIYWQALRLWGKKTPFFSHPDTPPQSTPAIQLATPASSKEKK